MKTYSRKQTRQIQIGNVKIGGNAPVSIQSMTNTDTRDPEKSLFQIQQLADAGCQIIRLAVPDMIAADAMQEIAEKSPIPVIADIHFDYRLALRSVEAGVHGIRINPGNIGSADRVRAVVEAAGNKNIPIRVGANSGSLPKGLMEEKLKQGFSHDDAMAICLTEAVMTQIRLLEEYHFHQIKVSLKASSVPVTVAAYRHFADRCDYPLHIGVTEAGTAWRGSIKSAMGIGSLLLDGIGDTLRVSLTSDPVEEVRTAKAILEAAGLRDALPEIVSCPTCGRTAYDMFGLIRQVEDFVDSLKQSGKTIRIRKLAVMGCVVNGPGEAEDAELGIAGGGENGKLVLFKSGKVFKILPQDEAFREFQQCILEFCS